MSILTSNLGCKSFPLSKKVSTEQLFLQLVFCSIASLSNSNTLGHFSFSMIRMNISQVPIHLAGKGEEALASLMQFIVAFVCKQACLSKIATNVTDVNLPFFSGAKTSSHTGAIVGGTVGGIVIFVLILGGILFVFQRKRARRGKMISNPFGKISLLLRRKNS